jgi:hypothetical protein
MRRRSRASSKVATTRSRKAVKRRTASKDVHRLGASASHEAKVARLTRERDEALERETATTELLKVISSSPGELAPVFDAMLANATRLCEAKFGVLMLCEGDAFRVGALHNVPAAFGDLLRRGPIRPGPNISFARANCPLDEQDADNMIWKIYPDDDDGGHGQRHVVHGHHQHAHGPIFKKNRTNLDTLAWYTGRLVIGVFDDAAPGGPSEVLEVHGEPFDKILSSRRSRSPLATKRRADETLYPQCGDRIKADVA